MEASCFRKRLIAFCLASLFLSASLSIAGDETPSVLSRVQTVDDPELGELLRAALERSGGIDQIKKARTVTESYAQIKLLDRQIEQIQQRIRSAAGPAELRHELLLAAAELESKRVVELANLREAMGVVPEHAFGRRPHWRLKTWVELDAIDGTVHLLEHIEPFTESDSEDYKSVGLKSKAEALDYISARLAQPDALPIRIDVHHTSDATALSKDLENAVIALVKKTGREMKAEVHRDEAARQGPSQFILRLDPGRLDVEVVVLDHTGRKVESADPNGLDSLLVRMLLKPGRLPAQLSVSYPDSMRQQADQIATIAQNVTKRLDITSFVQVTQRVWEPDPKTRYIGRWRSVGRSEVMEIEIKPGETAVVSTVTISDSGQPVTKQASSARWSASGRQVAIQHSRDTYQGYINSEGNLILGIADEPVTFQKVE